MGAFATRTVGFTFAGLPFSVAVTNAADLPVIESIQGDKIVVIKSASGSRVGTRGSELRSGEKLRTGPRASALILFPDGSKVIVAKATEIEIQGNENGTQWSTLNEGEVRGIIKKATKSGLGAGAPAALPRHRFGIRTKSAVMGVRGTDFVFAAKDSALHTLEGVVEVAQDEAALLEGKGVSIGAGQFTKSSETGIAEAQRFNAVEYVRQLRREEPELLDLAAEAAAKEKEAEEAAKEAAKREAEKRESESRLDFDKGKPEEPRPPVFKPWSLQFAPAVVIQENGGGSLFTLMASWNPTLNFRTPYVRLGLRGHFSLTPLKSRTIEEGKPDKFLGWEAGLLGSLRPAILPLFIEVGFGRSGWASGHSKAGGLFMLNLAYKVSEFSRLERVFVGISHFDKPNPTGTDDPSGARKGTNTLRAGVGIQF